MSAIHEPTLVPQLFSQFWHSTSSSPGSYQSSPGGVMIGRCGPHSLVFRAAWARRASASAPMLALGRGDTGAVTGAGLVLNKALDCSSSALTVARTAGSLMVCGGAPWSRNWTWLPVMVKGRPSAVPWKVLPFLVEAVT